MIGHDGINMSERRVVRHIRLVTQRHVTNIFIKGVMKRVAIQVSFIRAYRVFIPLAGKHALPAYGFKTPANAANARKQIDKTERIVRMMLWRQRQMNRQPGGFSGGDPHNMLSRQLFFQVSAIPHLHADVV